MGGAIVRMSLISANSNEILVGKPLPWALYDCEHNLLLANKGDIVRDDKHRDALLTGSVCHELSWEMPGKEVGEDGFPAAEEAPQKQSAENKSGKSYTFDDMKLKVGDRLNLELPADHDFRTKFQSHNERFLVKVIGFLKGGSLLVTAPNTTNAQIIGGKKVVMRFFSGQNAFGFSCSIEEICKVPYEYLHLSFPDSIEGIVVRKAPRVKTRIMAAVQGSKPGAAEQIPALISDISASGASLDAQRTLGGKGDILSLSFHMPLHNIIDAYLSVKGVIRAVLSGDAADASKPSLIHHGVEFQELQPNDCLILQSMVYQQMIENPHELA